MKAIVTAEIRAAGAWPVCLALGEKNKTTQKEPQINLPPSLRYRTSLQGYSQDFTRKLSYRKDDRAMRSMVALKIFGSP